MGQLPATVERAYNVLLLDYDWHEPLVAAERGGDAAEQDAEHVASQDFRQSARQPSNQYTVTCDQKRKK